MGQKIESFNLQTFFLQDVEQSVVSDILLQSRAALQVQQRKWSAVASCKGLDDSVKLRRYYMKFSQERLFCRHQIFYFHRKKSPLGT